jgi:hypothetical protein
MFNLLKQGRFMVGAAIAGALLMTAGPVRGAELEDLIGDWNTMVYAPDGPQLADLMVEEGDDDGLFAISRSSLGEVEIDDIAMVDGKYVLKYWVVFNGVNSDIQLTIDLGESPGDTLTGVVAMNQGALTLKFDGARKGSGAETEMLAKYEALKAPPAAAEGIAETSDAAPSDAKLEDLVGQWLVLVLLPEGPQTATIDVQGDAEGLTATLASPLGENEIDDIELEDGQHIMTYMMDLGGQPMDIQVLANVHGDTLDGTLLVGGGAMELAIEAAKQGTDEAAALQARADAALAPPAAETSATTATEEPASQPESQPTSQPETAAAAVPPSERAVATATIGEATVSIDYGRPTTAGAGYKRMEQGIPDGLVWRLGKNAATRLETNAKLKIGETVLDPGEYGLWARRSGDHWDLVLNSHARVWGIPYRADGEIGSAPMSAEKTESSAEYLTITIDAGESGGTINVHWGNDLGKIAFEIVE